MKKNTSYAPDTRNKWEQIKKIFESVISKEKGIDITDINEPVQPKKGVVASNENRIKNVGFNDVVILSNEKNRKRGK